LSFGLPARKNKTKKYERANVFHHIFGSNLATGALFYNFHLQIKIHLFKTHFH